MKSSLQSQSYKGKFILSEFYSKVYFTLSEFYYKV